MPDERIYIVVPRTVDSDKPPYKFTMTCGRMAAHVGHVAGMIGQATDMDMGDLTIISLSVASSQELLETSERLRKDGVEFIEYYDEDHSFEGRLLTAIGTLPRPSFSTLKHLRPWCCACNEVKKVSTPL